MTLIWDKLRDDTETKISLTLNTSITTVYVDNVDLLPEAPFHVLIFDANDQDNTEEVVYVSAKGTNYLNIERGKVGTTDNAHSKGSIVSYLYNSETHQKVYDYLNQSVKTDADVVFNSVTASSVVGATDYTKNIEKFGGSIWYVNKNSGSDTNNGETPTTAFETIGAGITAMSDGDALNIKAGTYTETGLNLSNVGAEMWMEIGVLIDPVSGTALTISGASCRLMGMHKITPAALAIGLLVSGAECHIEHGKIIGGSAGICITGSGVMINNYACGFQTTAAYDIQGAQARLTDCSTVGDSATIGYKVNNNVDTGVIKNCTSVGHATAGYSIATGSQDWSIVNCSSGAGDGRNIDVDNTNVWSNYTFDDMVYATTDWSAVGGSAGTSNLFKVSGAVSILYIYGDVHTALNAAVDNIKLELDDGTNQLDITTNVDSASAPAYSLFIKTQAQTEPLKLLNSSQVRLNEDSTTSRTREGGAPFIVTAKNGANTYIRIAWTGTGNTGSIHWHCQWVPLIESGFVEQA